MYFTNFAEEKLLNTFRGITATQLSGAYVGLFLSDPGEAGTGTEISYAGYVRVEAGFTTPTLLEDGISIGMRNVENIVFAQAMTSAGRVTHLGLFDSQAGGNMHAYMQLDEPITVDAGTAPVIVTSEWNYVLSGNLSAAQGIKYMNWLRGAVEVEGFAPMVALFGGDPESGGAELTGAGYARFPVVFGAPAVQPSGQSMIINTEDAVSGRAQVTWGTWAWTAIYDQASSGNLIGYKQNAVAIPMTRGQLAIMDAGLFSVSLN